MGVIPKIQVMKSEDGIGISKHGNLMIPDHHMNVWSKAIINYCMVGNFRGVLVFIIYVVHSVVMKISIHEN